MDDVDFSAAWTLLDIARAAELYATEERHAPTDAEVTEGACADWYLIQTFPGDEARAARWLARRRFGVFRPMQQRHAGRNAHKLVQGWEPVFPGWLFVFCWDVEKMFWRIVNCPGVMSILCEPATGKPVPVDTPEMRSDGRSCRWPRVTFIDRLRALSWVYDEAAPALASVRTHAAVRGARQAKRSVHRLTTKERRDLHKLKDRVRARRVWDDEAWERANRLDPGQRLALLKRTLLIGTADDRLPGHRA